MFDILRKSKNPHDPLVAHNVYNDLVDQARQPIFYKEWGVPDTVEGRFEMIVLHMFFVLKSLQEHEDNETAESFSQSLFDIMFLDMDRSLREQGVGDLGVPKHIKRMAKAFYGRVFAYEKGLEEDNLTTALHRNVYANTDIATDKLAALALYSKHQYDTVMNIALEDLLQGNVKWAPASSQA